MKESCSLIYSSRFGEFSYGDYHPFNVQRYRLSYELIDRLGLLQGPAVRVVECPLASEDALLSFHDRGYIDTLKEFSLADTPRANFKYGLGDVENPVFKGVYEWSRLGCGGTIEAARQVLEGDCRVAFNLAGGYHHAHAARASGFSYLNDAVVAINGLLEKGLRVVYVDIDAHHGDGVQEAFYDSNQVMTISLHESGKDFFPYSGFAHELGRGDGYGYSVNVSFCPHSDDLIFEQAFKKVVLPLIDRFNPDILVTQMGVDSLRTDPLTRLEFTTGAIEMAARAFHDTQLPWVVLGGGGYDELNVARCCALIWGIIVGATVPDELPAEISSALLDEGVCLSRLRDLPHLAQPDDFSRAQSAIEQSLSVLERRLFPLHGLA